MTLLEKFHAANQKVDKIEKEGGLSVMGYGTETTAEYDAALEEAQNLFMLLEEQGIDPFA